MVKSDKHFIFPESMWIVLLIFTAGCAPVISKQIRDQVRPDITFAAILKDPEHFKGQMIVLSGVIIDAQNTKEGTLIKILHRPAGYRGKPKEVDESEGRFLALVNRYLDVFIYAKGRSVTIAGEIEGKRILQLEKVEYTYPLINVKEIYLWPVEKRYYSPYPSWHIGFGYFY